MKLLIDEVKKLCKKLSKSQTGKLNQLCTENSEPYPFHYISITLIYLLLKRKIDLTKYLKLKKAYKNRNENLWLYEKSSSDFGKTWAEEHLINVSMKSFLKPTKEVDKDYDNHYDLYLEYEGNKIKLEVKASRAVEYKNKSNMLEKALPYKNNSKFDMNFQQIKIDCADIFIFIAIWTDTIQYWVFSSWELNNITHYSKHQHRGNIGEGQIHFKSNNIHEFKKYRVEVELLKSRTIKAYCSYKEIEQFINSMDYKCSVNHLKSHIHIMLLVL